MKKANERGNLVQNFDRLNQGKIERGNTKAKMILGTIGTATAVYNMVNSPAGKASVKTAKKFLKSRAARRILKVKMNGQQTLF